MTATAVNFDSFLPEGRTLKDFQHVGIAYAIHQTREGKGTFIADEQGLGKTVQAIVAAKVHAALQGIDQPRILIVCKAALKGNWEHEISMFAPEWDVQVLAGKRPYEATSHVNVISFNLLSTWKDALVAESYDALIIDESHVVKDPATQQTKAAIAVSADIRARKGLVLLLSGTPILNRPVELVSQLLILGRLEEITPAPRKPDPSERDWEFAFKFTFCGAKKNDYGKWEFKGSSKLDLLNLRLRSHCMVRRLRDKVLNLSETNRIQVPLNLNGGLKRYRQIEAHFQPKDPRSFWIELLTALRQEVAHAKIEAAVEWVEDFLADNDAEIDEQGHEVAPAKKLVVWAWHIEAQREIAQALNAAGIEAVYLKAEQDKGRIEAAKARFNAGTARVIVCSLQAHREGHTLLGTGLNVTDSLFVESPWHPGAVRQAEDRISRIGRQAKAVFAHTLIVPGTTDEWLADLIAEKWAVSTSAIDGKTVEGQELDTQRQLLLRLRKHLVSTYGASRIPDLDLDAIKAGDVA